VLMAFMVGMTSLYQSHGQQADEHFDQATPQKQTPASESFKGLLSLLTHLFSLFLYLASYSHAPHTTRVIIDQCRLYWQLGLDRLPELCVKTHFWLTKIASYNMKPCTFVNRPQCKNKQGRPSIIFDTLWQIYQPMHQNYTPSLFQTSERDCHLNFVAISCPDDANTQRELWKCSIALVEWILTISVRKTKLENSTL